MTLLFFVAHLATCMWIRLSDLDISDIQGHYINNLYFLITTASTCGYGDVTVDKDDALLDPGLYVGASLVILFGLNYFVIFIAFNKNFIEQLNLPAVLKNQAIDELEDWFAIRNQTSGVSIAWYFEKLVKGYNYFLVTQDLVTKLSYGDYYDKLPYAFQAIFQEYIANDLISAFEILEALPRMAALNIAIKYSSLQ